MGINEKMTSIANGLRTLSSTSEPMSLDAMSEKIATANTTINEQSDLIIQIKEALKDKGTAGGGTGEPAKEEQEVIFPMITENGNYEILPDDGKVMSKAIVNVEVPTEGGSGDSGSNEQLKAVINGTLTELTAEDFEDTTTIRAYTFYGQTALETVDIPDNITSIAARAFYNCQAIKSLNIPITTVISSDSFYNCANIDTIVFTPGIGEVINYTSSSVQKMPWYLSKANIKNITLCEGITKIGENTFRNMNALENIVIPKTVTELGYGAFYIASESLDSIYIPRSVTKIGEYCFNGWYPTAIYYEGSEEEWSLIEIGANNSTLTRDPTIIHYNTPM